MTLILDYIHMMTCAIILSQHARMAAGISWSLVRMFLESSIYDFWMILNTKSLLFRLGLILYLMGLLSWSSINLRVHQTAWNLSRVELIEGTQWVGMGQWSHVNRTQPIIEFNLVMDFTGRIATDSESVFVVFLLTFQLETYAILSTLSSQLTVEVFKGCIIFVWPIWIWVFRSQHKTFDKIRMKWKIIWNTSLGIILVMSFFNCGNPLRQEAREVLDFNIVTQG